MKEVKGQISVLLASILQFMLLGVTDRERERRVRRKRINTKAVKKITLQGGN